MTKTPLGQSSNTLKTRMFKTDVKLTVDLLDISFLVFKFRPLFSSLVHIAISLATKGWRPSCGTLSGNEDVGCPENIFLL